MLGQPETWKITFLETGEDTLTAGRILQAKDYIGDETFLLTYGDGLANINLFHLISYHQTKGLPRLSPALTKFRSSAP